MSSSPTDSPLRRKLRLLCAHADADARAVFESAVALDGDAQLSLVHSGAEAIVRAATEPFEIIVLDARLTDMHCYDVCRWFNADPAARAIPVLILTDRSDSRLVVPIDVTVLGTVSKPVDPRTLTLQLRAALASAEHEKK